MASADQISFRNLGRRSGRRPLRVVAVSCRDLPGSALSAERAAGQIRFLPDDLRVQHGVQRSEVSARPRPCSRRGCVDWAGRFRAASRCARGRGASGLHNENAFFLLTAPPPFSFCRRKKKMGVESPRPSPVPPVGQPGRGTPYLGHGLRRPNFVPKFGASVRSSAPTEGQRCNSGLPASEQGCSPCIPGPGRRPPHCGSRDRSSLFARGFDPLPDS